LPDVIISFNDRPRSAVVPGAAVAVQEFEQSTSDPNYELSLGTYLTIAEVEGGEPTPEGAWRFTPRPREAAADEVAGSDPDGPMADRALLVVLTNAVPGRADEFNTWYDDVHLSDVVKKMGGFTAARRYDRVGEGPWGYLALYEIDGGNVQHAIERIVWGRAERVEAEAAGREPQVPISPAMDEHRLSFFYSARTARVAPAELATA
jgi:hypothetical protein